MIVHITEQELRELEKWNDDEIHSPYACRTDIVEAYLPRGHYKRCRYLFFECKNLKIIHCDEFQCDDCYCMFGECSSLTDISPLKNWKPSNCYGMFSGCSLLTNLEPLKDWRPTDCSDMFCGCNLLTNLKPLKDLNPSNSTCMFIDCELLTDITPLRN